MQCTCSAYHVCMNRDQQDVIELSLSKVLSSCCQARNLSLFTKFSNSCISFTFNSSRSSGQRVCLGDDVTSKSHKFTRSYHMYLPKSMLESVYLLVSCSVHSLHHSGFRKVIRAKKKTRAKSNRACFFDSSFAGKLSGIGERASQTRWTSNRALRKLFDMQRVCQCQQARSVLHFRTAAGARQVIMNDDSGTARRGALRVEK